MKAGVAILMGVGLTFVTVACGESSSDLGATSEPRATAESITRDQPVASATTAATSTTTAPAESTSATTEPPLDPSFYQPPVLTAGGAVAAEMRLTSDPSAESSIVEFRLVEFEDGPFIETTVVHLAAGAEASLWNLFVDDRLRSKFSYPTGRHGSRITPEQYNNGVTVMLVGTDSAGDVIVETEAVVVPPS